MSLSGCALPHRADEVHDESADRECCCQFTDQGGLPWPRTTAAIGVCGEDVLPALRGVLA
jgi:hypothetical protein